MNATVGLAARRPDAVAPDGGEIAARLRGLGRAAVVALYDELALAPKPGLVSFVDSGSHGDMNAQTFLRSLFALRHCFPRLAHLGAAGAAFSALETEGIAAEARMLLATRGVNTHRGAIFCLGLLCASAGAVLARGDRLGADALRQTLIADWGDALSARAHRAGPTPARTAHGIAAAQRFGLRSAGPEAALAFPVLFETTLPALRGALRRGAAERQARLQALFETIAVLDDTNLAHRGGLAGLRHAQRPAQGFLAAGGVFRAVGLADAEAVHADFVARRLSPGGAADMLAAACWVQRVCGMR
ncbi:triphosphoribosyl-dephospho-CoA synthase MdcB [Methylibium sp.]|uniref:triphosphoribosyl-dephospho-CoA synthase MdcB n=1 Tax=Methylibium sp. TaxID=2067992 RepID=UPI00286A9B0A|nr:triphosphoribosyl-dephospho-CoA synthase MdcB [Methylibium sp.]